MIESPVLRDLVAKTRQSDIARVLRNRFGSLPDELLLRIRTIDEEAQLDSLFDLAISCRDLPEFKELVTGS